MSRQHDVGLFVYSDSYDHAMDKLNLLFSDHNDHEFRLLPETALGTGVSFPDGLGLICRTIFPCTAAIVVRVTETSDEELRLCRAEETRERFW
jgi:hypothetical protein